MLMLFMETVEFCYRVKWIKYILSRNVKSSRSTAFGWFLCREGAGRASCGAGCSDVVPAVVLAVMLSCRLLFSRV